MRKKWARRVVTKHLVLFVARQRYIRSKWKMAEKIVIISLRHKKKKGLGIFKEFLEAMIMFDVKIQKANMI